MESKYDNALQHCEGWSRHKAGIARLTVGGVAVKTAATRTKLAYAGSKPSVRVGEPRSYSRESIRRVQSPNH